ncbi:hypothetical protein F5B18DRAFT_663493 [Nemania serpens]|nr:hypothetical protein F5B18DRAFT_663493 [Nemania serpens]
MPDQKEPTIAASFISHLRQSARVTCPVVGCGEAFAAIDDRIRNHLQAKHHDFIKGKDLNSLIRDIKNRRISATVEPAGPTQVSSTRDPGGGSSALSGTPDDGGKNAGRRSKFSVTAQSRARSTSPLRRSRARPQQPDTPRDPDFLPRSPQQGQLWDPEADSASSPLKARLSSSKPSTPTAAPRNVDPPEEEDSEALRLIKQPETRPIGQEQLVAEVKGIYAGLMMVESKCIEVDNAQSSHNDTKLNNEQWQALIALHRTLLHEHHDFFLASQHPSASPALKRLASKYAMPARMWRHGIHSFLELLRHRLPTSLEHMLTFIYLAYSMMALLYETVPAFEDTWIECLGDLGRYRMAIEDEDIRDREIWTAVSRHWYSKASDKAPTTGRLYHHLAILARPNAVQQLFYYTKSLCVPIPFGSTKDSIMSLFDPILGVAGYQHARLPPVEVAFVRAHGILFSHKQSSNFGLFVDEFLGPLNDYIRDTGKRWVEPGYHIAIANCCALLSYGKEENGIMRVIQSRNDEAQDQSSGPRASSLDLLKDLKPSGDFEDALHLAMETHEVVLNRWNDPNVLPYAHVVMVFMLYLARIDALYWLEHRFPWKRLSLMLNKFLGPHIHYDRIYSNDFPRESYNPPDPSENPLLPVENLPHPLPEDFALKGLLFVDQYYPSDWFSNDKIDDDEKYFELASMIDVRKERILWLGYKIAQSKKGLTYDEHSNSFGVFPEYEKEIEEISKDTDMMNISDGPSTEPQTLGVAGDAMDIDEPHARSPNVRML